MPSQAPPITEPSNSRSGAAASGRGMRAAWLIAGLLFAALVAAALFQAWPVLYPEVTATAPLDPACDLRSGPCTARFPSGGQVLFGMEPRTLPVVAPLRIVAEVARIEPRSVEVDFAGTDMNMGYNRVELTQTKTGRYEGQVIIPMCVRARMGWEAKVMLHTGAGIWVAPFRFETSRRP